jgi:hypothetical protein
LTQSVNVFSGVNSDDTLAFGRLLEACDTDPKSTGVHGLSEVCAGEVCVGMVFCLDYEREVRGSSGLLAATPDDVGEKGRNTGIGRQ